MTDPCAVHRPYLAAIADGELDLVPEATRDHVSTCPDCGFELRTHMLLGSRLREAALAERARIAPRFGRLAPLAVAATLLVAVAGVELASHSAPVPLPVADAVLVADRQPAYWSSSPSDLAAWCTAQYGNRVPAVTIAGLQPVGARMDWTGGVGVATVTYRLEGRAVHVSWLTQNVAGAAPAEMTVAGRPAVVVQAHGITAVVTGDASEDQLMAVAKEVGTAE